MKTLIKLLKHMAMVWKDYRECKKEFKQLGHSKIPILGRTNEELRNPEAIFQDQPSFTEVFLQDNHTF